MGGIPYRDYDEAKATIAALTSRLTTIEAVLAAAVVRVEAGHSVRCSQSIRPGCVVCDCGHDALAAACGKAGK